MRQVISRLDIYAFISFYNISFLCVIFQARRYFFYSGHHSFYRYCHTVENKYLEKTLNRIFVLLEMLSQYLPTVIIRDVFKHDGAFCQNRHSDHASGQPLIMIQ